MSAANTERRCKICGKRLSRKKENGVLEDEQTFLRRKFCSVLCEESKGKRGLSRKAYHARARKHRKDHCEACGLNIQEVELSVHHIDGDWKNNKKENLQTLCETCHPFWHALHRRLGVEVSTRMPKMVIMNGDEGSTELDNETNEKPYNNKLRKGSKLFVLRRIAEGFTSTRIADMVYDKYDIDISSGSIRNLKRTKANKKAIAEIRNQIVGGDIAPALMDAFNRVAYFQDMAYRARAVGNFKGEAAACRLIQNETGTQKDDNFADALRKSGPTINLIDYGKLPEDERDRRLFEWSEVFGSNGNSGGNSRF